MRIFTDFFFDKPKLVTMILVFLTIIGISAVAFLPKEAAPDITIPIVFVSVIYPGVSPEDIEQEITTKIETAVENLDDIDFIASRITDGATFTIVHFTTDAKIDEKVREVRDEVYSIRNDLPSDIQEPQVFDFTFTDQPVMVISLTADMTDPELKNLAEMIEDEILKISGVRQVDIVGALEEEVRISVEPEKLELYGITFDEIASSIRRENWNIPAGTLDIGSNKYLLRSMGKFNTIEELGDLVLSARCGRVVTLSMVADIGFVPKTRNSYARINGKECLNIIVTKKSDANLLRTVADIKTTMTQLEPSLPQGTDYSYIGDLSWSVRESNTDLMQNLLWGLLLVFAILLFFLGWRSALIICPSIPWSLLCGYIFIWAAGYSMSNVVTFGAIIVLGMLVDDAIIVTENSVRHLEMGKSKDEAAWIGIHEVGNAIFAAGLTTFAAFGPMLFMPGISGEFIKFIPLMVIPSLAGAIFIAHSFVPVLCRRFLKLKERKSKTTQIFGGWVESLLPAYERLLRKSIKHPFVTATIAWILFFIAVGFVMTGALGFELFPDAPFYKFTIDVSTPTGTNIEETNRIVKEIESRIAQVPEVEFYATAVGEGAASTNLNRFGGMGADNFGTIFGDLKEIRGGRTPAEIQSDMRERLQDISGANIEFVPINQGPPEGAAIEVRVAGRDFGELERISNDVQSMLAGIDGVVDIRDNYDPGFPEIQIVIDRKRAALNGLTNAMIGATIRGAFEGVDAGEFYHDGEAYDILVGFPKDKKGSVEDLRRIHFRNHLGQLIPFSQVADINYTAGVANIRLRDGKRTITIQAEIDPIITTTSKAQGQFRPMIEAYSLPQDYEFIFGGQNERLQEDFMALFRAMIIGLMLIFIILSIIFDSYYMPFNVIGAIPFACIGVVVGLWLTGNEFGLMPGIGILALTGIVVNGAIVLVDFINQQRRKSSDISIDESLIAGGKARFRPVLMTSITTIVGILPLSLGVGGGSEFWGPLGWSIIFGLLFSTVLILLIIPAFYKISEWLFCPRCFWAEEGTFLRFVRVVMLLSFTIGLTVIISGAAYFVLFTG